MPDLKRWYAKNIATNEN